MIGRFPDYDVLDSADDWDDATREVVMARLRAGPELRFFSPEQAPTARSLCDVVLAQDEEPRVPVLEMIDSKLADGRGDGYQYDDMPSDPDTWSLVLAGLDGVASAWHGQAGLADCSPADQRGIVSAFAEGRLTGADWEQIDIAHAWEVCTRMMLEAFYSHPWAWNEIGFGGPAYPQGYMRLGPLSVLEPRERPGASDEDPVAASSDLEP